MSWVNNAVYAYDGSFDGLLSCVFESYERKEELMDITSGSDPQYVLFGNRYVETDPQKATRVYEAIGNKISPAARELVRLGFLTCSPQKELLIYRFLRLGFKHGGAVMNMLTENTVHQLHKAVRHLNSESHAFMGFVRFSVYGDALVAVIEPKNIVLPVLACHFCDRYSQESFMIYDKTHGQALIHRPDAAQDDKVSIVNVDELVLPDVSEQEKAYRSLWKQFYNTVAIRERINPRAQMSHMPKRYWAQLTEMQ
ncbi:putative DNA metabolism protein [Fontibacillus phaseoli]|uniref:Putative DNA metabolism protein n=1 Tax=Fontibacillus phaseoli TaxID=1416533 RepID=A0A369BFP3_9BACL|nr:TIGR03915 family putative DNA repair protein [Fontibacillus phaseoli]RCX20369.1 putative DNA metabolism protein [Fontibacillus phaseoli]